MEERLVRVRRVRFRSRVRVGVEDVVQFEVVCFSTRKYCDRRSHRLWVGCDVFVSYGLDYIVRQRCKARRLVAVR
jgi:hypothetical protein